MDLISWTLDVQKWEKENGMKKIKRTLPLHLMLLPALILLFIFNYLPLFGNIMAFQNFNPVKGFLKSKWVGLDNFRYVLNIPEIGAVVWNTFYIAVLKIIMGIIVPVIIALLLNEMQSIWYKRTLQTIVYFPHFLSWVVLASIMIDILSPSEGLIGRAFTAIGLKAPFFLGNARLFPYTMVFTETWKEFGYGTIVYLAALTGIDPTLYEAAAIDGAGHWKQVLHITIPGIKPIVILMAILALGNVFNAGFDQIYNLYSPQVYATGDILDTLVYRLGLEDAQYSVATAVGLFKSSVSFIMLSSAYRIAYKYTDYRVF